MARQKQRSRMVLRMRNWFGLVPLLLLSPVSAWSQTVEFYHLDAIGNVLAVTSYNGAVVEQHDYLPYGEELCGTQACGSINPGQPKRFTGKERDAETGLDYFGARYYGSKIGRFTTVDPAYTIKENLVDPQRWNKYAYGRNNPLRYVDPDGRLDYSADLLGKSLNVHIDDRLSGQRQQELKSRLDASFGTINRADPSLTQQERNIVGNIKRINVDSEAKRSYVEEKQGAFTLTPDYVDRASDPYLGSAIGHDAFHVELFKLGGTAKSRGAEAEVKATEFQIGFGRKLGLTPGEVQHLELYKTNIERYRSYFESPIK